MKILWVSLLTLTVGVITYVIQHDKGKGLEIYQVKEVYDVQKEQEDSCHYCLNLDSVELYESPLFTEDDFIEFNWGNQHIQLNEGGKNKLDSVKIPLDGLPVVMVLNNEMIYGFWFWNIVSSYGCDRVYTYPRIDFTIKFGLPTGNEFGIDPRFDKRLEEYLD